MGGLTNVIKSPSSGSWVGAFQFPLNESADFTIKAIYSGQDIFTQTNYNEQSNTLRYHIKFKSDFTLNITDVEVDYGTKANITVEASEDGNYIVTVLNKKYPVTVKDGKGYAIVDVLAGNKTYDVTVASVDYADLKNTSTLKVNPISPNLTIDATNKVFTYGELTTISADKNADADGVIKFFEGDVELTNVENIKFAAGNHTITAKYSADGNFTDDEAEITITVEKATNNVKVIVDKTVLPNVVVVNVTADVDDTYVVTVGDKTVNVKVEAGKGNGSIALPAGENYNANTTWSNDNYTVSITNATFDVVKGINNIKVEVASVDYPNNVTVSVTADVDGIYTVDIGNNHISVKANSSVSVSLAAGNYSANVTYVDDNYVGNVTNDTFEVKKAINNIEIVIEDKTLPGNVTVVVKADVSGTYTVKFNNTQSVDVIVNDGEGSATIAMAAGKYDATTTFVNENYTAKVKNTNFTVKKGDVELKVIVDSPIIYGNDVVGTVIASVPGTYYVSINGGTPIEVVIVGTQNTFNAGKLEVNSYNVSVKFEETQDYNANSNKTTFNVTQSGTDFNATSDKKVYVYGEEIKLIYELPSDATGNITFTYSNGTPAGKVILPNRAINYNLGVLDVKSYSITAEYSGDHNYDKSTKTINFDVIPANNTITVEVEGSTYSNNVTISVTADIAGNYTVDINNTKLNVNVPVNGATGSISYKFGAGDYYANITYSNPNYNGITKNATFKVEKAINNIKVMVDKTVLPNDVVVNVTADVDDVYVVTVGNRTVNVKVKDGKGNASIALPAGEDYVATTAWSNDNYTENIEQSTFDVVKGINNIKVEVTSVDYPNNVTVRVTADIAGTYTVDIGDNHIPVEANTTVTYKLNAGNYSANVTYVDNNYEGNVTNDTFEVRKAKNNVINVEATEYGKPITVTVTSDVNDNYVIDINGSKVNVGISGTNTTALDLAAGHYKATTSWDNDNYETTVIPFELI